MGFPVKLFIIRENLVFMNNFYHRLAVISVFTTLSFILGTNKEAKAAIFNLSTDGFRAVDMNQDGLGDSTYSGGSYDPFVGRQERNEHRALYEFNLASLSFASNTVISRAIVQVGLDRFTSYHPRYFQMELFGYRGNGRPDASDFEAGRYLHSNFPSPPTSAPPPLYFYVTPFIKELLSKNDTFAGFNLRTNGWGHANLYRTHASLIIETADVAEPVPEPTTIFGSALALTVGGWLKRRI
jgi:hypothetical protein